MAEVYGVAVDLDDVAPPAFRGQLTHDYQDVHAKCEVTFRDSDMANEAPLRKGARPLCSQQVVGFLFFGDLEYPSCAKTFVIYASFQINLMKYPPQLSLYENRTRWRDRYNQDSI